jgi:hypothetical protein
VSAAGLAGKAICENDLVPVKEKNKNKIKVLQRTIVFNINNFTSCNFFLYL